MPPITIIGCGYVGTRLAMQIKQEAPDPLGVVHSESSARHLQDIGISAHPMDLDTDPSPPVDEHWVFYFAPPAPTGHSDQRIGHWLNGLARQRPAKIVLISTTGVYGDCGGRWITEAAPINPQTDRACRRVDAERQLRQWCDARQVPYAILRVPGIYGPHRLPRARLERRLPVLLEAESPCSNRIHVDDLIRACLAAASGDFTGVVHVSDGHPSTMTDYFNRVADALGLLRPEQISAKEAQQILSREMLSYLAESKRMDITRMRTVLGVEPDYADLDRGLSDCVASEKRSERNGTDLSPKLPHP
jgi:nucleoside-diphosphate-sugar epimerase